MTSQVHLTAPCELLSWDSEFFHCRIGKVRGDSLKEDEMWEIEQWSRSERIAGLYFLARANCPVTIQTAQNHGFELVDIRITLERSMLGSPEATSFRGPSEVVIRSARPEDLSDLQAIARTAHVDSRFFGDSHFPRHLAEKLYTTWISLECEGRARCVLVAVSPEDRPLGYVSCHLDSNSGAGQIGLSGVSSKARGRGIGSNLVLAALDWFAERGAKKVAVITQGKNIPAQRLYQRCGFVTEDLQLWYHKWFSIPVATDAR